MFTLPEDKVFVKGKPVWNIESQQLRIAVQPGKAGQMTAMCTVEYRDLKIVVSFLLSLFGSYNH